MGFTLKITDDVPRADGSRIEVWLGPDISKISVIWRGMLSEYPFGSAVNGYRHADSNEPMPSSHPICANCVPIVSEGAYGMPEEYLADRTSDAKTRIDRIVALLYAEFGLGDNADGRFVLVARAWLLAPDGSTIDRLVP